MSSLVLLKASSGSRAAIVLCPKCGRISRQILNATYDDATITYSLIRPHVCPICETNSDSCTTYDQKNWFAALTRYEWNADQYNQSVRLNYAQQTEVNVGTNMELSHDESPQEEKTERQEVDIRKSKERPNSTSMPSRAKNGAKESPDTGTASEIIIEETTSARKATIQDHSFDGELDRKTERWKRELLDTGKRNKMINFRETKRATLKILEPGATELFNRLAFSEKPLTFQKPINKDSDLRTYSIIALMETLSYSLNVQVGDIKTAGTIVEREKTLKNLRSKAKLAQEEQGTNILYLCFGFIYWRAQNRDSSPWLKAPLLLMPVTLGLKSLNAPFTISRDDDEIEVNPTLDYLFNAEYNIDLPKFDLKNRESFDSYLAQIEEIVDKRGWKVVREVSLGLLSFLKISMYHDLDNNRERMVNHPVIRAMAGDRKALIDIPPAAEKYDFDGINPKEWHEVIDSDSSQEQAILLSKLGVSFVMQGPPGTGKSQTITNIIAEALADGKKILFVSEKAAALEVVLKRLTEVQLDDFCLSLHNYRANKKEIINSIGANLNLEPEYTGRTAMNELTELFHDRTFLTQYARELHQTIEPLGESIYTVFGKLAKLEKASTVPFQFDDPASITREEYLSLIYVLNAMEKALQGLGGSLDSNPWHGTVVKTSGQAFKQQMIQETGNLPEILAELNQRAVDFKTEFRTSLGSTWNAIKKGLNDVDEALKLPLFPFWWTSIAKQETLLSAAKRGIKARQTLDPFMQRALEYYDDSILDAPLDEWIKQIGEVQGAYDSIGYGKNCPDENYLSAAVRIFNEITHLIDDLEGFVRQYKDVAERLGLEKDDSLANARKISTVFELLKDRPALCEKRWLEAGHNMAALEMIGTAKEMAAVYLQASSTLNGVWSEHVRMLDLRGVDNAFFEEYAWMYDETSGIESIADQLAVYSLKAGELKNKIVSLVDAFRKAQEVLAFIREDNLEGLRFISALLKRASEAPYLETAWFDVRKREAAQQLFDEAYAHYTKISGLSATILQKWEPEALAMEEEALSMLGRFKTEYVGAFHKFKAGYKEDIKRIRLLSKEVGRTIDESAAIAFLQSLKEIHDEKQWYVQNRDALNELAGSYYRGSSTDWEAVKKGMAAAIDIANCFPYGNIPEEVIVAIQRSASSVQGTAEVKELAELLSEERLAECETLLGEAKYVDTMASGAPLGGIILPQVEKYLTACAEQDEYLVALQAQRVDSKKISALELRVLLTNVNCLEKAEGWFSDNNTRLESLYGSKYEGVGTDFAKVEEGLSFAKRVMEFFDGNVPNALIEVLCLENGIDITAFASDRLMPDALDQLSERIRTLCSYCFNETKAVSNYVLPGVRVWWKATDSLMEFYEAMRSYMKENVSLEQGVSALIDAMEARDRRNQILNQEADLADRLGSRYQGLNTDWASIERDILTVKSYTSSFNPAVSREFLEIICDSEELREEVKSAADVIRGIQDATSGAFQTFCGYFLEGEALDAMELTALSKRYESCLNGFGELNKWLDYVEARAECDAKGLESFTAAIAEKNNAVADVCDAFERGFYTQWLSAVIDDVPAVQSFRRRVHEQKTERFVKLDVEQYEIARKRIREKIIKSFPAKNSMMRAGSELRILTHEMEKKQRIMPLRKLFQSIPNLLLTLKPCLMMSPLSVAYFLDASTYQFDMVIFDEASQIFPQDAIGAIFRAKQVIIAGDTRQLPPTNFFAASTSNSSEGYDDDEGYDEEIYDSILEETATVLPNRELLWHYRSKHEHLIAFSNQEIYRNNLVTFPSSIESEPDTGVEFVYVQDGYYEPSPKNYNMLEAQRCVQLVKEHIEKHPDRSLGIIAFSEKQQQAIALEIQRFRERNPEYEEFFAEGKDDEFFVKNLENVQGDERDTIFFSVGYAKTKEQKANGRPMSMRFGPLGMQGGERRLNVAITRAKINVKLVSSILPSDIDLSKTESEGIRMLRSYIEFAMNGEVTLSVANKASRPDDFADAIARFISDHGYTVRQYVGCSGYKIDIAVKHPSELIEQFVAGIECDGFSYASAKTARDRDRLRSSVLKRMGWNLYRVWSTEWQKNPEIEGQKLLEFINTAIAECNDKVKALEEERRRIEETKRLELEKARAAREAEERRKQREREEKEAKRRAELETAERKRREENDRKAARLKAEREAAQQREEERKAAEERSRKTREEYLRQSDLSWVRSGVRVRHKNFGEGVITKLTHDQVVVRLGTSERTFAYPSAFTSGIFTKVIAQERPAPKSMPKPAPKQAATKGPEWVKLGASVRHDTFGIGTIIELDGTHLVVQFGKEAKRFVYPDAFARGYLKQGNPNTVPSDSKPEQLAMDLTGTKVYKTAAEGMLDELMALGFKCVDNRLTSSIIWVIYSPDKARTFETIAAKYKVKYSLERRGALATRNKPAWRVMIM